MRTKPQRREVPDGASLTQGLVSILRRPVGEAVRRRAALHVLDWVGCAVIGSTEPAGRIFLADAADAPPGLSGVIGGGKITPRLAAFANGALGNVLEMDDVFKAAVLHPGPVVVPAALAAAEGCGASGVRLLDAVVRGYEAMIRLGCALGRGHYAIFHPTSTAGPFGAAAAVADVIGLSDDALVWALGNAGTQAAGLWQCRHEAVMTKQLHTAHASEAGFVAATMAARGLTGPRAILEGSQGLFAAMATDAQPEAVTAEPSGEWRITQTSIKPWPACRHAHPVIDAALMLRDRTGGATPAAVEIGTFGDALRFCDRPEPRTLDEAKFSLQHAAAVTLIDGPPPLDAFAPAAISRPDIAALRRRVVVAVAEPYAHRYPARFGARVAITLSDGRRLEADVPDALGDPENPLTEDALVAKAASLMRAAGCTVERAGRIIAAARALADDDAPRGLTRLLVKREHRS